MNADRFLSWLIKDTGQKVHLIVNDPKVHKAGKMMAWVKSYAQEIDLLHLPSYALDHNPNEHSNDCLKQKLRQQSRPGSTEGMSRRTWSVLLTIQRSPERIRGYFRP